MVNSFCIFQYLDYIINKNRSKYLNTNKNRYESNKYNYNKYCNIKTILDENPLFFT